MTDVATTGAGGAVAVPDEVVEGLEDYDPTTDIVTPRITISHKEAVFVNTLTNEKFPELDVIILGLVKQRALWPPVYDGGDEPPLCKSLDFAYGNPADGFPWKESGFAPADYPEGTQLPCASCTLREWGSHPTQNSPWCSEQHTFALIGDNGPALFSVQRTGIKPSRTYISSFAQSKTPMFTVRTKLTLNALKRGINDYCVPVFTRGEATDKADYPVYTAAYRQMRDFLQSARAFDDDAPAASSTTPAAAPIPATASAATPSPAAVAGTGAIAKDDDIPF